MRSLPVGEVLSLFLLLGESISFAESALLLGESLSFAELALLLGELLSLSLSETMSSVNDDFCNCSDTARLLGFSFRGRTDLRMFTQLWLVSGGSVRRRRLIPVSWELILDAKIADARIITLVGVL